MLTFRKYNIDDIKTFLPYFEGEKLHSCDYSLGIKYMWKKYFQSEYVIHNETLTLKENYDVNKYSFYYPMGKNVDEMFHEIKAYQCENLGQQLEFCCVDNSKIEDLKRRFPHNEVYYNNDWSDYLYLNANFQTFSGGAYSNKRHHVKRFISAYPETTFNVATPNDKTKLADFIKIFGNTKELVKEEAKYELLEAIKLALNFDVLGFYAFYLEYKGEIIAVSICEVINDCVYDHVEKALRSYNSVYPYFVQKIANYFKDIKYFNREDDSGDEGLRFSKQDYHPLKMINKNMFYVKNNLDLLCYIPEIRVNHEIILGELKEEDKQDYYNLYIDEKLNRLWGYDYKEDAKTEVDPDYFYNMVKTDFEHKEDFSFIIKKNNKLIGEIVLYQLSNENDCEIGYRLIQSEQNKHITYDSLLVLLDFLKYRIKMDKVKAKSYKDNVASIHVLRKLGFQQISVDENFNYYLLRF